MHVNKTRRTFTIELNRFKTLKSVWGATTEEKVNRELKLILRLAQVFGLAPISILDEKLIFNKKRFVYSALCLSLYIYVVTDRVLMYVYENYWEVKLQILYITILVSTTLSVLTDHIHCLLGNKKIQDYLNYVRRFDSSMNCRYKSSNIFVKWSWIILFCVSILFLPIVAFTIILDKKPILGSFGYFMFGTVLMIGIFKFLTFAMIIFIRFRALNSRLARDVRFVFDIENNVGYNMKLTWKRHKYLTSAAKTLNSKYTVQLLIWLSILSLNSILQIYEMAKGHQEICSNAREMLLALLFLILLASLTVVCHITAYEANKMGKILSYPQFFGQYSFNEQQTILSIGQYFQFNSFNFSALGLFNINLPLLMTIASGITTYLVILM